MNAVERRCKGWREGGNGEAGISVEWKNLHLKRSGY